MAEQRPPDGRQRDPRFPGAECWEHKFSVQAAREALESWLERQRRGHHNSITYGMGWGHAICFIPFEERPYWSERRRALDTSMRSE